MGDRIYNTQEEIVAELPEVRTAAEVDAKIADANAKITSLNSTWLVTLKDNVSELKEVLGTLDANWQTDGGRVTKANLLSVVEGIETKVQDLTTSITTYAVEPKAETVSTKRGTFKLAKASESGS